MIAFGPSGLGRVLGGGCMHERSGPALNSRWMAKDEAWSPACLRECETSSHSSLLRGLPLSLFCQPMMPHTAPVPAPHSFTDHTATTLAIHRRDLSHDGGRQAPRAGRLRRARRRRRDSLAVLRQRRWAAQRQRRGGLRPPPPRSSAPPFFAPGDAPIVPGPARPPTPCYNTPLPAVKSAQLQSLDLPLPASRGDRAVRR